MTRDIIRINPSYYKIVLELKYLSFEYAVLVAMFSNINRNINENAV